jgi:hypothetical protein
VQPSGIVPSWSIRLRKLGFHYVVHFSATAALRTSDTKRTTHLKRISQMGSNF